MLRRLIDVLCVAVVAAVITFAVRGREEYVTALNRDGVEILSYLNIPDKFIPARNSDDTANREPSAEEHSRNDSSAYSPICDDDIVPLSDTSRVGRCEHQDGQGERYEYVDSTLSEGDASQKTAVR